MEPAMAEPSDDDPFIEGMDAFECHVALDSCPYPEGSDERALWLLGWDEAQHIDEDCNTRG